MNHSLRLFTVTTWFLVLFSPARVQAQTASGDTTSMALVTSASPSGTSTSPSDVGPPVINVPPTTIRTDYTASTTDRTVRTVIYPSDSTYTQLGQAGNPTSTKVVKGSGSFTTTYYLSSGYWVIKSGIYDGQGNFVFDSDFQLDFRVP